MTILVTIITHVAAFIAGCAVVPGAILISAQVYLWKQKRGLARQAAQEAEQEAAEWRP